MSASKEARAVLLAWRIACHAQSGSNHVWVTERGDRFMWKPTHAPVEGPAIGHVLRWRGRSYPWEGEWKRSGSYRIAEDGTIERAPRWLLAAAKGQGNGTTG